ncbi:MAG TPA: LamG domain-containing protein [Pseudomonadota bacterium]|nr:LamG domain-containing protein [Pseudomonadota bacterium]
MLTPGSDAATAGANPIAARSVELWKSGLVFNGIDHAILLFEEDQLTGYGNAAFTLEAWIRTSTHGRRMQILSFGGLNQRAWFFVNPDGNLQFECGSTPSAVSSVVVNDGIFHHVAVVADVKSVQLYVDGRPSGGAVVSARSLRSGEAWIGAGTLDKDTRELGQWRWKGAIAEVRVWNRALEQADIKNWMVTRPSGREANLLGYWALDSAKNPGRDRSTRSRNGRASGNIPSITGVPVSRSSAAPISLFSAAEVVAATPPHQLSLRLSSGIELFANLVVPVRAMLRLKDGIDNPYTREGAKPDTPIDAALIANKPSPLGVNPWTGLIDLQMDSAPIPLTMRDLDELLGSDNSDALTMSNFSATTAIELKDTLLAISTADRTLYGFDFTFVLRKSWDLGEPWLGRKDLLVLRDPSLIVEIDDPLVASRDATVSLEGVVRFGSGDLRLGVLLPDLVVFADMVQGSKIYIRDIVGLFTLDEMPAPIYNLAISDLELSCSLRERSGSFFIRTSDLWEMEFAGNRFAVRELSLGVSGGLGTAPQGQIGCVLELAGVPLLLNASSAPGRGWTFSGGLGGTQEVGGQQLDYKLHLDTLIEKFMGDAGVPIDLPRIEIKTLQLSVTPKTGAFSIQAAAAADVPLGSTQLSIHDVGIEITRASRTDGIVAKLTLSVSGVIEEVVKFQKFTLDFTYNQKKGNWSLNSALNATIFDKNIALTASLFRSVEASGLRFTFEGTELTLPPLLPDLTPAQLAIGLRYLEVIKEQKTGWNIQVVAKLCFLNFPDTVMKYLPADLELRGGFKRGCLTLGISRLFAAQTFPVKVGDLDMGTMQFDLRKLSITIGSSFGFEGSIYIGLPSRLNHVFGTEANGTPKLRIFKVYEPTCKEDPQGKGDGTRGDEGLLSITLGLDLEKGLFAKLNSSPFEGVTVDKGGWAFDLKEYGAISIGLPELRMTGAGFGVSGSIEIDAERGLWLPLSPISDLFRMAKLTDLANALPRGVRLDKISLRDASGRINPVGLLGLKVDQLPPEVREAMKGFQDIVDKLPEKLKSFFDFELRRLDFSLYVDAAGNVCLDLRTARDCPLRAILPGFPFITCIELSRVAFGPLLGGSLLRLDIDAEIHTFDFVSLLASQLLPEGIAGKTLPASTRLQRTLHLCDLFMIVIYQAGIPIPVPLLYTRLGFTYVGLEGIESSVQLYFNTAKVDADGKPVLNVSDVFKLLQILRSFFTDPAVEFDLKNPPATLDLVLVAKAAYLKLPRYLGGEMLGSSQPKQLASAYKLTAGALNSIKFGSPRYILDALPLEDRIGHVEFDLCGVFSFRAGWVLATLDECKRKEAEVLALIDGRALDSGHPGLAGRLDSLMPESTTLALGDVSARHVPDPNGVLILLRGGFGIGTLKNGTALLDVESMLLLRMSPVSGFAMAVGLSSRIAGLLEFDMKGLLRISKGADRGFQLAGSMMLTLLGRQIMHGAFSLGDNHFAIEGMLDLFPPEVPIAVRGALDGKFSPNGFSLAGGGELSLLGLTLIGGTVEIESRKDGDRHLHRLHISTTLLGAMFYLDVASNNDRIQASGGCTPIVFQPFFSLDGSGDRQGHGPLVSLTFDPNRPQDNAFFLDAKVSLLGISADTRISITSEAAEFDLLATFLWGLGTSRLHCLFAPKLGFEISAELSLGVQKTKETQIQGKTESVELDTGVTGKLWIRMMRQPSPQLLADHSTEVEKLVEQQQLLFSAMGKLAGMPSAAATKDLCGKLAQLRELLADVRMLHYGLTMPGPSQLGVSALGDYIGAVAAAVGQIDAVSTALGAATAALKGPPSSAAEREERALLAEIGGALPVLRRAAVDGKASAEALDNEEKSFTTTASQLLGQMERPVLGFQVGIVGLITGRTAGLEQLPRGLWARRLFPADPWASLDGRESCAGFCDEVARRHGGRMVDMLKAYAVALDAFDRQQAGPATPLDRPLSPDLQMRRANLLRELDLRPLDPGRLPFVGLATPGASSEGTAASALATATRSDSPMGPMSFEMGMSLSFSHQGQSHTIAQLLIENRPDNFESAVAQNIVTAMAEKVLGIRNHEALQRSQLKQLQARRAELRRNLAMQANSLRLYHGLPREAVRQLLFDLGYAPDDFMVRES